MYFGGQSDVSEQRPVHAETHTSLTGKRLDMNIGGALLARVAQNRSYDLGHRCVRDHRLAGGLCNHFFFDTDVALLIFLPLFRFLSSSLKFIEGLPHFSRQT